jgi:hypothetical protein
MPVVIALPGAFSKAVLVQNLLNQDTIDTNMFYL